MTALPTIGVPLQKLAGDARTLTLDAFEARYARAFFLRHGSWAGEEDASSEATGEIIIVVLPVRRLPGSAQPFVGIGRLEACDIAILDETVSKLHATVEESPERTFLLQDNGSRNGTMVEGRPVAARGAGPPTTLRPGQVVRFGSVTTTFIDAAGVVRLATRSTRG